MATTPKLKVEILTAEKLVYQAEGVDEVIVPGADGELAILPRHAALITLLGSGELRVLRGGEEESLALAGGFMEVRDNEVTILSDIADRAEEIDVDKAREARDRAQVELEQASEENYAAVQAALSSALLRLRVAEKRRRRYRGGPGQTPS
ncbi:MAG: F0F1 ATP synthase subunit epsilon [Dehalococcoidia bacterium]